jgi:hypothetical protein
MATYPVYPSSLPCVSRINGFGQIHSAAVIKTPAEFGNSRQRRMHAKMPAEIQLAWKCSNAQYQPVVAWLNTYGYEWFRLLLAGLEASEANDFAKFVTVRLMSNINVSLIPIYRQNWWVVSASAEYQVPVYALVAAGEEDALMGGSEALFIALTRYFSSEPPPASESAYSNGLNEGFS